MSNAIGPGDRVRSHDFPGNQRKESYVEGTVLAIGRHGMFGRDCDRYTIIVERHVWQGVEQPAANRITLVYPPVNGTPTWLGDTTNGVVKL